MAIPLKYATAGQEIPLGHFLDTTDGDTEETALTIANTDIKLWKAGATTLANKNSGGATHISNGIYYATLDATDTNTYGPLVIFVHVAGSLAVRFECVVMEANAYDQLYSATGFAKLVDDIFDEALTGATHNVENSLGRRIRNLQEFGNYDGGCVYIDTVNGAAGTTDYESGTIYNPVDSDADAQTIGVSLSLLCRHIAANSSITLAAARDGLKYTGHKWTLALGGQSLSGSLVVGADVSGVCSGASGVEFEHCDIGNTTVPSGAVFRSCDIEGTVTLPAGAAHFHGCNGDANAKLDYGAVVANTTVYATGFSGDLTVSNLGANGTDVLKIRGHGKITLDATCVGGTVIWDGHFGITNNGSGVTIAPDDITIDVTAILADTNELQVAHTNGNLGADVDKINGVTITGNGTTAPFNVT